MSLTRSLKKHGDSFSEFEINEMKKVARGYVDEGYVPEKAAVMAVEDFISELKAEKAGLLNQIKKQKEEKNA